MSSGALEDRGREREDIVVKRAIVMALSVVLALVVAAPMAVAARQAPPIPVEGSQDLEAGAVFGRCDFPIRFELSGKGQTLVLPGDRFIFTSPELTATLTNLETGKQETLVITGAFHQTTLENGDVVTVATGRNLLGDPEAGFVLAIGNFSYVFDKKGNLVQPLSGEGQLVDICTLLE
jgi:hypothetical protein